MIDRPRQALAGRRILVVEDEYFIADQIVTSLLELEADVLGPFATSSEAQREVADLTLDYALVDLNLGGDMSFGLVDMLMQRQVPVLLMTGYDQQHFPVKYRFLPLLQKPFSTSAAASTFLDLI